MHVCMYVCMHASKHVCMEGVCMEGMCVCMYAGLQVIGYMLIIYKSHKSVLL